MKAFIKAISYVLPDLVDKNPTGRLSRKTGIWERHIAAEHQTASDLAALAAEKLFQNSIERKSVDYVIFCTQSPDYFLPTTACVLQKRLGLSKSIGAVDIDLGCSGYVYGLGLAKGLIESGQAENVLLLTAETYSKYINREDHSVWPLFGDGATATFIYGKTCDISGINGIVYGTDGDGAGDLIVPGGAMRKPYGEANSHETVDDYGNKRSELNLYMNGSAIMEFGLERVPETVEQVLDKCHLSREDVDYYVFHQANHFMLTYLQQKCGLLDFPFWNDVAHYGNTVSNSIPIALTDMMNQNREKALSRVMIVGFGVGLSWAGAMIDLSECIRP